MKLADVEERMQKSVEATQHDFNSIRTGRANAALLDRVMVDYYGTETPLRSLATISTPDATTILIQPYDRSSLAAVEKAIQLSDLGLTPNNDGTSVRLNIPPLTTERRKELVKTAAKIAENGKVAIRNIRRDAIDQVKKQGKAGELSEDQVKDLQDKLQKLTDKYISKVDALLAEKEKDIMTV
ncbi:ribosome recycling factor [Synechococcus sp. PCC 6717]|uniref:Ribosome-recycling factor n=1 Tax=Parathermosynechococcus lividus PCC 6715 TaxID=1917166 RepID=A0A2D2Q1J4_PARLV|nr:ribosome recycling factor [Thermostichus lividus]ATS18381.1 ribosome recycling factor [Thermostichus lividus PCC 6715]MCI3279399.1 ribosome recycling factor [Synechococcus sp. PCC 6717]